MVAGSHPWKMPVLRGEWAQTSQKCLKPSTTTATAANWCSMSSMLYHVAQAVPKEMELLPRKSRQGSQRETCTLPIPLRRSFSPEKICEHMMWCGYLSDPICRSHKLLKFPRKQQLFLWSNEGSCQGPSLGRIRWPVEDVSNFGSRWFGPLPMTLPLKDGEGQWAKHVKGRAWQGVMSNLSALQ